MQLEDPKHRFTSQTQRMALVDLLDSCDLQSQDRADLVTMLSSCNFAQDDMVCLLEKVAGPSMPAGAKGGEGYTRRGEKLGQDYTQFVTYAPENVQEGLLDEKLTAGAKKHLIFDLVANLGLRRGNEHTYKLMTSVWLVHSNSSEYLGSLNSHQKWTMKNQLREEFLRFAQSLEKLSSFCQTLPSNPLTFRIQHMDLYQKALGNWAPEGQTKLKWTEIAQMEASYQCRNQGGLDHRVTRQRDVPCISAGLPVDNGMSQIQHFATFMMAGMKQMQESQHELLRTCMPNVNLQGVRTQPCLNGQAHLQNAILETPLRRAKFNECRLQLPGIRSLSSLPRVQEVEEESPRAAVEIGGPSPELAASDEMQGPSPESAASQEMQGPSPESATLATMQKSDGGRASPSVAAVLHALQERNRERSVEKRIEKKAMEVKEKKEKQEQLKDQMKELLKNSGSAELLTSLQTTIEDPKKSTCSPKAAPEKHAPKEGQEIGATLPLAVAGKCPTLSHEKSRSQIMVRNGMGGPGSSKKFRYGKDEEYCSGAI